MHLLYFIRFGTAFMLLLQSSLISSNGIEIEKSEDFVQHIASELEHFVQERIRSRELVSGQASDQFQSDYVKFQSESLKGPPESSSRADHVRLAPVRKHGEVSQPSTDSIIEHATKTKPLVVPQNPVILSDLETRFQERLRKSRPSSTPNQQLDGANRLSDTTDASSLLHHEEDTHRSSLDDQYSEEEIVFIRKTHHGPERTSIQISDIITQERLRMEPIPKTSKHKPKRQADTCSSGDLFNREQTCAAGNQYDIEPHFSSRYSRNLYSEMYSNVAQSRSKDSLCNYNRTMKTHHLMNERALCPSTWTLSPRNSARIPEYLYIANCTCYIPKGIANARCKEFMTKIRVIWRIDCKSGKHVYREGWEEIPVACIPVKYEKIESGILDSVEPAAPA